MKGCRNETEPHCKKVYEKKCHMEDTLHCHDEYRDECKTHYHEHCEVKYKEKGGSCSYPVITDPGQQLIM